MSEQSLLLNADYSPLKIVPWQRAVELVLDGKAVTVEQAPGKFVRSASLAIPWPEVVALRKFTRVRGRVKFSARNVQARDSWTCAYCGARPTRPDGRPDRDELTVDHVVPRAQSQHAAVYLPWAKKWVNVTCWENGVCCCRACNARKADRRPDQAGMALRFLPRIPTQADVLRMSLAKSKGIPPSWVPYLPLGAVGATPAKAAANE